MSRRTLPSSPRSPETPAIAIAGRVDDPVKMVDHARTQRKCVPGRAVTAPTEREQHHAWKYDDDTSIDTFVSKYVDQLYRKMYVRRYNETGAEPKMPSLSAIIRDSGLTLSELHRRSGVSRITLSRITNGRQAISRQTADKLAPVLGMSAEELMQSPSTRPAAPEVLRISALRLKQWGETRRAEEELPGLVSRLIRSELFAAGFIRAPSDERIIESGPDIAVNNPARATRHVPGGPSVWEVSTRADVQKKAAEDLGRASLPTGWQQSTTSFVFVTTQPWAGAKEWVFQQIPKHPWRSITVLNATDLQSWIEESLGVQLWLMDRMGLKREGFQWLRVAVQDWSSVADPPPVTALLTSSVERQFTAWREWLRSPPRNPLTVIGESKGEALLFVQALMLAAA